MDCGLPERLHQHRINYSLQDSQREGDQALGQDSLDLVNVLILVKLN